MLKRTFSYVDQHNDLRDVVASIDAPKKIERTLDTPKELREVGYTCAFHVTGAGLDIKGVAFGIDEFHAVLGAFRDLRFQLDALGNNIQFLGEPGYTGIPRMVTLGDRVEVQRSIEAVLDKEHRKREDELTVKQLAAAAKR